MKNVLKIIGYILLCIGNIIGAFYYAPLLILLAFLLLYNHQSKTPKKESAEDDLMIFTAIDNE